ncbi:U11/U12 small nuclear ribonucleoprotein 35 kDa protein-like [Mya arenaria]|uniref:U11/U12 small nuclear ribonucleoprotein 35 kDa protein-like n=1 Tax=Mya arenaria TaxID=6604 RepID=UPI0022E4B3F0|nr:U11/U12 small nuclear ribonucleoprotein 35 kDa protein-like [Mya arenaria]XP_052795816.1 U11/U12 small nuclear ribonucleoprotein 35 kDa protein-like [Mya arenaria]XP_052795818.1 U11/U12 small nuclear ribonucleoprotein 35 kDa protein-like [Mya arenaria]XP_052795819.1 U11/U12 small nuclear ribonucleoprotein 35 kDa protein-like [Mya arenaria]
MTQWSAVATTYDPLKAGSIDGTDDEPHDRAIARAMGAKYKPNKNVVGDPECTVFVGRLSPNTDEEMLGRHFKSYGKIKRFRLVRDIVTGFSRCYGFIEFYDREDAYNAQRDGDKTILDEKEIYVDFECGRTLKSWIPRRLGGGICGKKESGQLRFGGKNKPFKRPFNINSIQNQEGTTFRERLQAAEGGEQIDRDRSYRSDRARVREDRHGEGRYESRSTCRGRRSRSRDRHYRKKDRRSRSRERR